MQIDVSALKSIFNPKLRPLIGVDISSTAIKMVELVDVGKGQPHGDPGSVYGRNVCATSLIGMGSLPGSVIGAPETWVVSLMRVGADALRFR